MDLEDYLKVLLGEPLPDTDPYPVTRVGLEEFAAAVGHTGPLPPMTFPIVVCQEAFEEVRRRIGSTGVILHRGQSFRYERPIHAGDTLVASPVVTDVKQVMQTVTFTVRMDIRTVDGAPVAVATSMLAIIGSRSVAAAISTAGANATLATPVTP
jgi:hypothetical protein